MAFIKPSAWAKYMNIINEFHEDAFQDTLTWLKHKEVIPTFGEDESSYGQPTNLKCLFNYNYFRTWPLTGYTITGEADKQSEVAILNIEYLKGLGLLDSSLKLIYEPERDVFIHRNNQYIATGDTFVAQANDTPLLFILILKRIDNPTYEIPTTP